MNILNIINIIIIALATLILLVQFLYFIFIFFKPKKYKDTNNFHKIGIVIPARNEEIVIANIINCIKNSNYPKDLIDIFVIAHNCQDNTASVAKKAGAIVIEYNDNSNFSTKGYALNYGFNYILKNYNHEGYHIFDADNLMNKDYFMEMNKAFDEGYKILTGFRSIKNFDDNTISGVNSIYYLRDSMLNNHARTKLKISALSSGCGIMIAREILENGWNYLSLTEDIEFSIDTILKGYKAQYVSKAIFYDEQPDNLRIAIRRHARIGKGVNQLYLKNLFPLLKAFFTSFKYKYLDILLNISFTPICLVCVFWFPIYYSIDPIIMLINQDYVAVVNYILYILKIIGLYLIIPITIQNIILLIYSYKYLISKKISILILSIILFPLYNMLVMLATTYGILRPSSKWKEVRHSKNIDYKSL